MQKKAKTFISVGKFLHNCAALVSLFKPPVRFKKSNTRKLAPMRGKLTMKRDKKKTPEKTKKENSTGSRYSLFVRLLICIKMKERKKIRVKVCVGVCANTSSVSGTSYLSSLLT